MCHNEEEDDQHLFFNCHYAQEVWSGILDWWDLPTFQAGHHWMDSILTGGSTKSHKLISYAIFAAGLYYIWWARNLVIFQNKKPPSHQLLHLIKEHVRNRILFLDFTSHRYQKHIDRLLL